MRSFRSFAGIASVAALVIAQGCAGSSSVPYSGLSPGALVLGNNGAATSATLFVTNFYAKDVVLYPAHANDPAPRGTISQGLSNSYNLAVDRAGTLYVQGNNNTITEFPQGSRKPSKVLTEPPAGPGGLGTGVCVVVGADETVYAVDLYGSKLFEFAGGATSPTTTVDIAHPFGLAIDSKNNLYVGYSNSSNGTNSRVMEFGPGQDQGKDLGIVVKSGGGLNVDLHDDLLVGDQASQLIDIFKPGANTPFRTISTAPNYPYQFAFDRDERHLYLVSGTPAAAYVYDYASGNLQWTDSQGLSPSGYATGVAVRPAAPL